jgi:dihydroorotate dehydrogenase electron transfer subunit
MLGILGNGYDLSALRKKRVLLLGGGIGIPPMLELAARLSGDQEETEVTAALGYRDSSFFLREEMERFARVLIATEDGSAGTAGNVLDAVRQDGSGADVICACGPLPMLKAVKKYAAEKGIPAFLSLEERMACGIGVCLGCVAKTTRTDAHSHVQNARVCVEGPVFPADDVDLD